MYAGCRGTENGPVFDSQADQATQLFRFVLGKVRYSAARDRAGHDLNPTAAPPTKQSPAGVALPPYSDEPL